MKEVNLWHKKYLNSKKKEGGNMDFQGIKNYKFFISLGYVTIISSILTLIVTQIIKIILKKKNIINEEMFASKKDIILSRVGRIISLINYSSLYLFNEFYLKHNIVFDETLCIGLISGSALTLTLSKGIYTMLHQYCEKKTIFEKIEYLNNIENVLKKETNEKLTKEEQVDNMINEITKNKWVLTNKGELVDEKVNTK